VPSSSPTESQTQLQDKRPSNPFNRKVVVVTGELSGETHAYHLIRAIQESCPIEVSGMGSTMLKEAGVHVVYDYRKISITGLFEIFKHLKDVRIAFRTLTKHIAELHPSLVILVDFPGFNLMLARFVGKLGIPLVYFIPPQIWAWRKGRIRKIKRFVDLVLSILPFEKTLYDEHGVRALYVGHPFVKTVRPSSPREAFLKDMEIRAGQPVMTIMPGSRVNEVLKHMPLFVQVTDYMRKRSNELAVILPVADNIDRGILEPFLRTRGYIRAVGGRAYDALSASDIAIIASGSATLEAAVLGVPTIVLYKISWFSYLVARALVKVPYISLPNLIAEKEVFPEFIQHIEPEAVAERAINMLNSSRDTIKSDMDAVREKLGNHDSYHLASKAVIEFLESKYGTLSETA
jgi:lipid-A-disaccharide synthase